MQQGMVASDGVSVLGYLDSRIWQTPLRGIIREALGQAMSCKEQIVHYFSGLGFRPAVWAVERDQYGDRSILIVGDDTPCVAKLDPEIFGMFSQAYNSSLDFYSYAPVDFSSVPVPQGILCMLTVIGGFFVAKHSKAIGDWFTAERGGGEGKNGWV